MFLFEMANIRDQCSWIHMHEPEKATQKSKDLVRMAIAKSRFLEPLSKSRLGVTPSAVVVGGGLAGMTAALDIAQQGYKVELVERTGELGGRMNKLLTPEGGKSPRTVMHEIIKNVQDSPNITLHMNSELEDLTGFVGNFKAKIRGQEYETGAVVVAVGGEEYKPKEFLYGQEKNVITQTELEEKLHHGPLHAKKVAMIQCVGSRNKEAPYCSRVCCSKAVKNAIEIKRKDPTAEVYVFHKDIRTYGFRESLYKDAAELGVKFVRFPEDKDPVVSKEGEQPEDRRRRRDPGIAADVPPGHGRPERRRQAPAGQRAPGQDPEGAAEQGWLLPRGAHEAEAGRLRHQRHIHGRSGALAEVPG